MVDTGQEGGADAALTDRGPGEDAKEGWYWPDQALEGGAKTPDAKEKPSPPITATGCDLGAGQGPLGDLATLLALLLTFALVVRVRLIKRRCP